MTGRMELAGGVSVWNVESIEDGGKGLRGATLPGLVRRDKKTRRETPKPEEERVEGKERRKGK